MFEKLIFPVEKKPIYHAGKQTTKSKIVRTDSNKVISVVSNDYLLIPNRLIIDGIMKEFHGLLDISHDGYMKKKLFTNERYSSFELPLNFKAIEVAVGDAIGATLRVENSYDTTKALTVSVNALRLVCSNGMTVNKEIFSSKVKHIGDLSPEDVVSDMINKVSERAESSFNFLGEKMSQMTEKFLTPKMKEEFVEILSKQPAYIVKAILAQMQENKPETLWDLYNCVTFVMTHKAKPGRFNTLKIEDEINQSVLSLGN